MEKQPSRRLGARGVLQSGLCRLTPRPDIVMECGFRVLVRMCSLILCAVGRVSIDHPFLGLDLACDKIELHDAAHCCTAARTNTGQACGGRAQAHTHTQFHSLAHTCTHTSMSTFTDTYADNYVCLSVLIVVRVGCGPSPITTVLFFRCCVCCVGGWVGGWEDIGVGSRAGGQA